MARMRLALRRLSQRSHDEGGFGLIELLIALTVLAVGVLATVGLFESSLLHLGRATKITTAAAVGEQEMEQFRAVTYSAIGLEPTAFATAATNATYIGDGACASTCMSAGPADGQTVTVTGSPFAPSKTVTGADGKQYRADTYILWRSISGGRAVKDITIVVRELGEDGKTWARISSSFDESTGL
jgi:prepilin-type N-terminal cleavage/methylation domain-containing protein